MTLEDRLRRTMADRAARAEVSDDAWAAIAARTHRRRRPRVGLALAGAALPLALAVTVGFAVLGDDDSPEVVTEAGPAGESGGSPEPGGGGAVAAYDHSRPGPIEKAGPGEVVAVSLDGSALIVSDFDGRNDEPGCEGMAEPILLRASFDRGRREVVGFDPEGQPLSGRVVRGSDGRVAVLDICEEYLGRILLAHETPDGTFTDVTELKHPLPGEAFVTGWSASGDELLAIAWVQDGGTRRSAVRVDVTTGEMSEIVRGDFHDVGELYDGSVIVAEDTGMIRATDVRARVEWRAPGELFAISPDRRTVAVSSAEGINLYAADGDSEIIAFMPPNGRVAYLDWSTSGETLTYVVEPSDTTANPVRGDVYVVTPGTSKPVRVTAESDRYAGPVFSPSGDLLAFTRYDFDPEFSAEALIARFTRH